MADQTPEVVNVPQRLPACDHHWVAHHQADVMIWIPRCSLCGRYKAAEINEQIAALAARRLVAVVAGDAAQARLWLQREALDGDTLTRDRLVSPSRSTEWRYIANERAARGLRIDDVIEVGTFRDRPDEQDVRRALGICWIHRQPEVSP